MNTHAGSWWRWNRNLWNQRRGVTWQTGSAHLDIWSVRLKLRKVCGRCSKWPPGRRCRSASARRGEDVCSCKPHTETHTTPSTFQQLTTETQGETFIQPSPLSYRSSHFTQLGCGWQENIYRETEVCVNTQYLSTLSFFFCLVFFLFTSKSFSLLCEKDWLINFVCVHKSSVSLCSGLQLICASVYDKLKNSDIFGTKNTFIIHLNHHSVFVNADFGSVSNRSFGFRNKAWRKSWCVLYCSERVYWILNELTWSVDWIRSVCVLKT